MSVSCIIACHHWANLLSSKTLINCQSGGEGGVYAIRNRNSTIFTFYGENILIKVSLRNSIQFLNVTASNSTCKNWQNNEHHYRQAAFKAQ